MLAVNSALKSHFVLRGNITTQDYFITVSWNSFIDIISPWFLPFFLPYSEQFRLKKGRKKGRNRAENVCLQWLISQDYVSVLGTIFSGSFLLQSPLKNFFCHRERMISPLFPAIFWHSLVFYARMDFFSQGKGEKNRPQVITLRFLGQRRLNLVSK